MTKNLSTIIDQNQLETETANALKNTFLPLFDQAEEWTRKAQAIVVTDASQKEEMLRAREARLALKNIRTTTENTRKRLKEDSLRKGKAIDGIANVIKFLIEPIEEYLERQEKFVEMQEARRIEELIAKRKATIEEFGGNVADYPPLGELTDAVFDTLIAALKAAREKQLETERLAEEARAAREKAEAEERERVRLENEKLKAEAAARDEELRKEREERAAAEEQARKEREAAAAAAAEEKAKAEAEARAQREARERAEAELRAKQEADARAAREAAEKAEAEKSEEDKQKKNEKYKAWLAENGVTPTNEYEHKIERNGNTFTLYRLVSIVEIN